MSNESSRMPHCLINSQVFPRLLLLTGLVLLTVAPPSFLHEAQGKSSVFGFGTSTSTQAERRRPDGVEFLYQGTFSSPSGNVQLRMQGLSSLDNSLWWTSSSNTSPWTNAVHSGQTANFPAFQVNDPIPAGGAFYFGHSYQRANHATRNDFREVSNTLPAGSMIYIGYSNFGSPSGLTQAYVNSTNNVTFQSAGVAPPMFASQFGGVPGAYSWLQYRSINAGTNTVVRIHADNTTPTLSVTEVVYVVVLPDGVAKPVAGVADNQRLTWTWTVDAGRSGNFSTELGGLNANYGNLLVPEPSRTMLLALALWAVVMRRSRRSR